MTKKDSYLEMLDRYHALTKDILDSLEGGSDIYKAMECLKKRGRYLQPLRLLRQRHEHSKGLPHIEKEGYLKHLDDRLSVQLRNLRASLHRDQVMCSKLERTLSKYVSAESSPHFGVHV